MKTGVIVEAPDGVTIEILRSWFSGREHVLSIPAQYREDFERDIIRKFKVTCYDNEIPGLPQIVEGSEYVKMSINFFIGIFIEVDPTRSASGE